MDSLHVWLEDFGLLSTNAMQLELENLTTTS